MKTGNVIVSDEVLEKMDEIRLDMAEKLSKYISEPDDQNMHEALTYHVKHLMNQQFPNAYQHIEVVVYPSFNDPNIVEVAFVAISEHGKAIVEEVAGMIKEGVE